jgi:hypothetical protein
MKSLILVITAGLLVSASAYYAQIPPTAEAAQALQKKIDTLKHAHTVKDRSRQTMEVSEVELESYLLFQLREDIPARMDHVDVQLTEGAVAADTRLTFAPDATGNTVMDLLISGTHNFFVKGKLAASGRQGKFELEQVKVDGIPVPNILIETLINRYVKPQYPDVDLNAPFEMPWGIESLVITPGKTTIVY